MVSTLDGGDSFRQWFTGIASVRSCADHTAKIDMTGCREHIDSVLAAFIGRPAVDQVSISIEYVTHDAVGIIVVVTVFRCFEQEHGT